jgi:hypothetical protein
MALLLCWGFDVLAYVLKAIFPHSNCAFFACSIVYSFFLQLQGFVNALIFGITNRQFREFHAARGLFYAQRE